MVDRGRQESTGCDIRHMDCAIFTESELVMFKVMRSAPVHDQDLEQMINAGG